MFDTATLTIVGNVVANPQVFGEPDSPDRATFRVVSNRRVRDVQTGEWKQVGEYGMNVVCWRKLARGVAHSVRKGDPVLVRGRVTERKYVTQDNQERWHTELTAGFVGHDLSQGYAGYFSRFTHIDRVQRTGEDDSSSVAGEFDTSSDYSSVGQDNGSSEDASSVDDFDESTAGDFDAEPVGAAS